nr:hypothetical protein [Tolivirales sp.]
MKQEKKKQKDGRKQIMSGSSAPKMKGGTTPGHKLDSGAQKWLNLIKDPCNAPLTGACYSGTGSGFITRTRQFFSPPGTATDFVMEITPSLKVGDMIRYSWSATPGGGLGTASTYPGPAFISPGTYVGKYRPVAGCVRVHYIGAELSRAGQMGYNLTNGLTLTPTEAIAVNAPQFLTTCATVGRTPDRSAEARWAPGNGDGEFVSNTNEELPFDVVQGNSLMFVCNSIPPGTINIEINFVWEWVPPNETGVGMQTTAQGPASRNHTNEILAALGDLGKFVAGKALQYGPYVLEAAATLL